MDRIYSLHEAREWFINHFGSVLCIWNKSNEVLERECSTYEEAKDFYEPAKTYIYFD